MVDCLLTQIETNKNLKNKIGIECLIETALGMSNIKEIAKSSERLEALHFGVADYAASLRARTVVIVPKHLMMFWILTESFLPN